MSIRVLAVMVVGVLVVASCGSDAESPAADDSLPPASDDSLPPVTDDSLPPAADGYEHPMGPDDVVIEYVEIGGFTTREFTFQQTPNVLVSGEGLVFGPGAQIAIYPGPLLPAVQVQPVSEQGIQSMLAAADEAGLLQNVKYEQPTNIADASTARVTINVNGETFVHEAYALGSAYLGEGVEESTPERQALVDFIAELNDLPTLVGADELGEQILFDPAQYGIEALVVDDLSVYAADDIEPRVSEWPAEVSVRLADASACTVVSAEEVGETLVGADQLTFFTDADVTYQVLAKPILPGTDCA